MADPAVLPIISTEEATPAPPPPPPVAPPTDPAAPVPTPQIASKPKKTWGKGVLVGSVLALVLLVGGLGTGVLLSQRKQEIKPASAWNGAGVNSAELQKRRQLATTVLADIQPYSNFPTKDLYNGLVEKAPDAEVVSFREQSIDMEGTAYLKYVDEIAKTFVFARIVGLPHPDAGLIRLWITADGKIYEPVGIVEFTYEPNIKVPVGYSVFVSEKDLRTYQKLIFSYDSSVNLTKPENPAITLNF